MEDIKKIEGLDNFDLNSVRVTNSSKLFFMHIKALIIKRLRYFKRDKRGLMCELFLPCLVVLFGMLIIS